MSPTAVRAGMVLIWKLLCSSNPWNLVSLGSLAGESPQEERRQQLRAAEDTEFLDIRKG